MGNWNADSNSPISTLITFKNRFVAWFKSIWKIATGIPAFFAFLNFCFFGMGANTALIQPVMKPRPHCNIVSSELEGTHYITSLSIEMRTPLYLEVMPLTASVIYEAKMEAHTGWTFSEPASTDENGPVEIESLYSSQPNASKVLSYHHRIVTRDPYHLSAKITGPLLVEGECPFTFSVKY